MNLPGPLACSTPRLDDECGGIYSISTCESKLFCLRFAITTLLDARFVFTLRPSSVAVPFAMCPHVCFRFTVADASTLLPFIFGASLGLFLIAWVTRLLSLIIRSIRNCLRRLTRRNSVPRPRHCRCLPLRNIVRTARRTWC